MTGVQPIGAEHLKAFREMWIAVLWEAMRKTGKGYRRPKDMRDGRRPDKEAAAARGISNKMRSGLERMGR